MGAGRCGTDGACAALCFFLDEMGGGMELLASWRGVEELNELGACEKGCDRGCVGGRDCVCELNEDAVGARGIENVDEKVGWVVTDEAEGHGCCARKGGRLPELTGFGQNFHDAETEGVSRGGEGGCVEGSALEVMGFGGIRGGKRGEGIDAGCGKGGCECCVGEGWGHEG